MNTWDDLPDAPPVGERVREWLVPADVITMLGRVVAIAWPETESAHEMAWCRTGTVE